jgi:subtilase family serine protease
MRSLRTILSLIVLASSAGAWAQQLEAPDLVVASVRLDPAFPTPGSTVQIIATVTNQGTRTTNDVFAVEFKADRVQIGVRFFADLAPGQSLDVAISWDAKPGETVFRVTVDPFKTISELDESNNTFYKIVNATNNEFTGADLVVRRVSVEAESLTAGEPARLVATVANIGQGPAAFVPVGFYVDGELLAIETVRESLPAGQEMTIAILGRSRPASGSCAPRPIPTGKFLNLMKRTMRGQTMVSLRPCPIGARRSSRWSSPARASLC